MNNVESLKMLHAKLGGNPSDVDGVNTTAEMIEALSDLEIGGGGSSAVAPVMIDMTNAPTSGNITLDEEVKQNIVAAYNATGAINVVIGYKSTSPRPGSKNSYYLPTKYYIASDFSMDNFELVVGWRVSDTITERTFV